VLLVAMSAPGNYGPEYKRDFDAIYPDLAAQSGALLAPGFFAPLLEDGADPASLAQYLQPDGLHPNRDGVARIVEGLGPQVLNLLAAVPKG
jgi:acyl-CoA thioesterase-1